MNLRILLKTGIPSPLGPLWVNNIFTLISIPGEDYLLCRLPDYYIEYIHIRSMLMYFTERSLQNVIHTYQEVTRCRQSAILAQGALDLKSPIVRRVVCNSGTGYCTVVQWDCSHHLAKKEPICKIWGFHGSDYEQCRHLGYINTVLISQETHYVSTTENSQLMLCRIWGFHGGDYEECRLLVRTSQETYYVSTTVHSQLILHKIWGFHGGGNEECRLLGCDPVWLL
jgi:hypothetical protein